MALADVQVTPSGSANFKKTLTLALPFIGMFVLALLLWLPFGFKTTGLIEELSITERFDEGHSLFFITPDSVMSISRSRPLQMFFFNLSYVLDPNSYAYYNVFMMLFFFGKIVLTYGLVLQFLPGQKWLAFIAGVLFMLYPADTGLFPLRTIHIHSSIVAYLLAVYWLIQTYKQSGWKSGLALLGSCLMLIFSLGQYQIALAAAVVTPFVLLYFGRPNRRMLVAAAAWYVAMALILGYEIWASKQPGPQAYEAVLLPSADLANNPIKSILLAIWVGYQRQISGWIDAFNKLSSVPLYSLYIGVGLVVNVGVGAWWLRRKPDAAHPLSWPRFALILLTAIVFFVIGISTYLPLPNYRFENFRIYLLAMLGSALTLAMLLYLISRLAGRYRDTVFLALALPFIGLGYLNTYDQHQRYVNYSLEQQNILQQTIAQAPQIQPDTAIVVMDPIGALKKAYVFYYGTLLQIGMRYIYDSETILAIYCPVIDGSAENVLCQFQEDGLLTNTLGVAIPYNRLLIFETGENGLFRLLSAEEAASAFKVSGYDPASRITGTTPPLRASTLFSCVPALSCYKQPNTAQNINTTRFDLPETTDIGFGWREMEFTNMGKTIHWSVNPTSTVDVNLSADSDLTVEFEVLYWMDEELMDSLKLSVGGQEIPLRFTPISPDGRLYTGVIPRSAVVGQPHSELVFTVSHLVSVINDPNTQLGFALGSLRIRPA